MLNTMESKLQMSFVGYGGTQIADCASRWQ